MDLEKTIRNLKNNEWEVRYFETAKEAAAYLDSQIDGKTVGFGDSETLRTMGVPEMLAKHNTVYNPIGVHDDEEFAKVTRRCLGTDIFLTSVNAIAETGQMVNIDGTGNRVAGSIFGHEKVSTRSFRRWTTRSGAFAMWPRRKTRRSSATKRHAQ